MDPEHAQQCSLGVRADFPGSFRRGSPSGALEWGSAPGTGGMCGKGLAHGPWGWAEWMWLSTSHWLGQEHTASQGIVVTGQMLSTRRGLGFREYPWGSGKAWRAPDCAPSRWACLPGTGPVTTCALGSVSTSHAGDSPVPGHRGQRTKAMLIKGVFLYFHNLAESTQN